VTDVVIDAQLTDHLRDRFEVAQIGTLGRYGASYVAVFPCPFGVDQQPRALAYECAQQSRFFTLAQFVRVDRSGRDIVPAEVARDRRTLRCDPHCGSRARIYVH
jgi:hypothetical protein